MNKQATKEASCSLMYLRVFVLIILLLILQCPAYNQSVNLETKKAAPTHKYFVDHNPVKAMWMSAALPGLGQYYNHRFWKIPIVYTGFASLAYFSILNKQEYVKYRDAYSIKLALKGEPSDDPNIQNYSSAQLLNLREFYQGRLELNYILFGAFYLLQIIDATVDAHFYDFNIDDNLSLSIDPIIYQNRNQIYATPGLKLRLKLGNP